MDGQGSQYMYKFVRHHDVQSFKKLEISGETLNIKKLELFQNVLQFAVDVSDILFLAQIFG